MQVKLTEIPGVLELQPNVFEDARGYFFESYNLVRFINLGIPVGWVQDNESRSRRGVIRGIHYQLGSFAQAKLVRVVVGHVRDVAVDLRKGSPTFGKYVMRELDDQRHNMLFIHRGFGHAFSVLSEYAVVQYKCDALWAPEWERGVHHADPTLAIDWGLEIADISVSEKDDQLPMLSRAELFS